MVLGLRSRLVAAARWSDRRRRLASTCVWKPTNQVRVDGSAGECLRTTNWNGWGVMGGAWLCLARCRKKTGRTRHRTVHI